MNNPLVTVSRIISGGAEMVMKKMRSILKRNNGDAKEKLEKTRVPGYQRDIDWAVANSDEICLYYFNNQSSKEYTADHFNISQYALCSALYVQGEVGEVRPYNLKNLASKYGDPPAHAWRDGREVRAALPRSFKRFDEPVNPPTETRGRKPLALPVKKVLELSESGKSIREIANITSVNRETVRRIVAGERKPTLDVRRPIAIVQEVAVQPSTTGSALKYNSVGITAESLRYLIRVALELESESVLPGGGFRLADLYIKLDVDVKDKSQTTNIGRILSELGCRRTRIRCILPDDHSIINNYLSDNLPAEPLTEESQTSNDDALLDQVLSRLQDDKVRIEELEQLLQVADSEYKKLQQRYQALNDTFSEAKVKYEQRSTRLVELQDILAKQ